MPTEHNNLREGAESQAATDVNTQKGAESSTDNPTAEQGKTETLESVIKGVVDSHSSGEKAEAGSGVRNSNKTAGEEGEKGEGEKEESQTQEQEDGEKAEEGSDKKEGQEEVEVGKDVPYNRFKEVIDKRNELETRIKELEPGLAYVADITAHMQKNNITEQQFNFWMDVAAMANTDPAKALETMKPLLEKLQGFTGDKLPSDIQAMVDNNEITLDVAKRLVRAENQSKFGQQRQVKTEQQILQERQQQYTGELTRTMNSWLDGKKTSDPDFVPKKGETEPDGKFEFFIQKMQAEAPQANVKSAKDLATFAEKVYASINASFNRFTPKKQTTTSVNSRRSSNQTKSPESLNDVVSAAAAKHGITFSPSK